MEETRAAMGRINEPAIALYETWNGLLLNTSLCKKLNLLFYFLGFKAVVAYTSVQRYSTQFVCVSFLL